MKGFTLIELLIAMSLMFMTLTLAMFGYQSFTMQWQRQGQLIQHQYQQLKANELLVRSLKGLIPYVVNYKKTNGFYFLGKENGFTGITNNPIYTAEGLAVIRVFSEKNPDGGFRLVYEEASLQNVALTDADQQLPFNYRLVIIEKVSSIEFSYFYTKGLGEDTSGLGDFKMQYDWVSQLDGITSYTNPVKLKISLDHADYYFTPAERAIVLKSRANIKQEVI